MLYIYILNRGIPKKKYFLIFGNKTKAVNIEYFVNIDAAETFQLVILVHSKSPSQQQIYQKLENTTIKQTKST